MLPLGSNIHARAAQRQRSPFFAPRSLPEGTHPPPWLPPNHGFSPALKIPVLRSPTGCSRPRGAWPRPQCPPLGLWVLPSSAGFSSFPASAPAGTPYLPAGPGQQQGREVGHGKAQQPLRFPADTPRAPLRPPVEHTLPLTKPHSSRRNRPLRGRPPLHPDTHTPPSDGLRFQTNPEPKAPLTTSTPSPRAPGPRVQAAGLPPSRSASAERVRPQPRGQLLPREAQPRARKPRPPSADTNGGAAPTAPHPRRHKRLLPRPCRPSQDPVVSVRGPVPSSGEGGSTRGSGTTPDAPPRPHTEAPRLARRGSDPLRTLESEPLCAQPRAVPSGPPGPGTAGPLRSPGPLRFCSSTPGSSASLDPGSRFTRPLPRIRKGHFAPALTCPHCLT